jgi:hypothetical protein
LDLSLQPILLPKKTWNPFHGIDELARELEQAGGGCRNWLWGSKKYSGVLPLSLKLFKCK